METTTTRRSLTSSLAPKVSLLLLPCLLLCVQAGWTIQLSSAHQRLQGDWEGKGPPGKISVTIKGNSLRFHARDDFWYEATFTLPTGVEPPQLHATITDSSPPAKDIGVKVIAIYKIEDGALTLAVDDGSDEAPASFLDASSHYDLERILSIFKVPGKPD